MSLILPMIHPFASRLHKENHVWHLNTDDITDLTMSKYCCSILSEDEKLILSRFHFEKDRHQYLVSHAFVRCVLSQYANISPKDWEFSKGEYGRPKIKNSQLSGVLDFNLTHTDGLSACVISLHGTCGIDAEKILPNDGLLDIAENMYSAFNFNQLKQFRVQDNALFLDCFYSQWVLREAYVKATGLGISADFKKITFKVESKNNIKIYASCNNIANSTWDFWLLRSSSNHLVAVASEDSLIHKKVVEYCFVRNETSQRFEHSQRGSLFS